MNLVLTLCDPGDSVVMFAPYYFNAYMSFQMTGITDIIVGPGDSKTLQPDAGKMSYHTSLLKTEVFHIIDLTMYCQVCATGLHDNQIPDMINFL